MSKLLDWINCNGEIGNKRLSEVEEISRNCDKGIQKYSRGEDRFFHKQCLVVIQKRDTGE